jgi:hypothetical protein
MEQAGKMVLSFTATLFSRSAAPKYNADSIPSAFIHAQPIPGNRSMIFRIIGYAIPSFGLLQLNSVPASSLRIIPAKLTLSKIHGFTLLSVQEDAASSRASREVNSDLISSSECSGHSSQASTATAVASALTA